MNKIWFVTGSSRGLGRTLVEAILAAGDRVIATARKPEELKDLSATYADSIRAVKLDVTSPADVEKAVATAVEAFGRIDVLINNAGYGFLGAFEEMSADEFKGQIDTNFWGVVNVTRANRRCACRWATTHWLFCAMATRTARRKWSAGLKSRSRPTLTASRPSVPRSWKP
jgi:NAD(P)-dependent dehydrogenase (short-subunit alcohol dehydrogenase family)